MWVWNSVWAGRKLESQDVPPVFHGGEWYAYKYGGKGSTDSSFLTPSSSSSSLTVRAAVLLPP